MAGIKKVIDGDTVILDTGEKIRMLGVDTPESAIFDHNRPNLVGGWASSYYLKRWIGSSLGVSVTVEENFPAVSDRREQRDLYGRYLRRLSVGGTVIEEDLLSEGLASIYDFDGTLDRLTNKAALEAAVVVGAAKVLNNPSLKTGYERTLPPRFHYQPEQKYYRRIYVDMSNGVDAEIQALIDNIAVVKSIRDLVYTETAASALGTVATSRASVPHPNSPICETLVLLTGTASTTTTYKYGPDSISMTENGIVPVGSSAGVMTGAALGIGEHIFAAKSVEILPGSTDLAALTEWLSLDENDAKPGSGNTAAVSPSLTYENYDKDLYGDEILQDFPDLPDSPILNPPARQDEGSFTRMIDWLPPKTRMSVRPDDRIYYGGVDCQIFVNGEYLDEATYFTHNIDVSRKPHHSFNSVHTDFFSHGKHYISGVLRFTLVRSEMLRRMVQKLVRGNSLSPTKLMQLRSRYRAGLMNDGLNAAIDQMREFYAERMGGDLESPSRKLTGFLNDLRADSMSVLVGAADIPIATDQPIFSLNYEQVVFLDFSTGISAGSNVIEGQASFIASRYTESVFGEQEDFEIEPESPIIIVEPTPLPVAPPPVAPPTVVIPITPVTPEEEAEIEIAETDATIPAPDLSVEAATVSKPRAVPDQLSAARLMHIIRSLINNPEWYITYGQMSALVTNFPDWIDTSAPLSKMFRANDFNIQRNDDGTPKDSLIRMYSYVLGMVAVESDFNLSAKYTGAITSLWGPRHETLFDHLNNLSTQPGDSIQDLPGSRQYHVKRTVRNMRSEMNSYGYAFPETTEDAPMTGATRATALTQFREDWRARGPLQTLGLYYMLEHEQHMNFDFYRTYVNDVDHDWFVDPPTPGLTDVSVFSDEESVMAMNLAKFLVGIREMSAYIGTWSVDFPRKGKTSTVDLDDVALASAPFWHFSGAGIMEGYGKTGKVGKDFATGILNAYNDNRNYFKQSWSTACECYRGIEKYDDAGAVDASGSTIYDRIKAAITVT